MSFERLTEYIDGRAYSEKGEGQGMGFIIDRLAEYEDTGLSPQEVAELAKAKSEGRLVETVRCVACKYYKGWCENIDSAYYTHSRSPMSYCEDGEPKDHSGEATEMVERRDI